MVTKQLAYKAWQPCSIFHERKVRTSALDKRDRGLSMTTNLDESGHGPFLIVFKPGRSWEEQFAQCRCGVRPADRDPNVDPQLYKNECFAVEQEWWSQTAVSFEFDDVERVVFMENSPATRIHPRKTRREWQEFQQRFPFIRVEVDSRRHPLERSATA